MKKKVLTSIGLIVIISSSLIYWWIARPYDEAFYIPEGFVGCASIVYNIQGVPALKVENHTLEYHLDKDGILLTSSPYDLGWEGKKTSGFHKTKYFYINKDNEVSEIPIENIGEGTLGEYSENGRIRITRYAVPIGNKELSCANEYKNLDNLIDEKLNVE